MEEFVCSVYYGIFKCCIYKKISSRFYFLITRFSYIFQYQDEEAAKKREEAKQAQQRKMSGMGGAGENGGGGFKMPKKSGARKPLEKKEEEVPAFAGMKLKKSERVQRKIDGPKMETVDLKHHEFEKLPLEESVRNTLVDILS